MVSIRSKQRVSAFGEVFTPRWLVNEMLGLVETEVWDVESRFLEPACGTGNFLVRIAGMRLQKICTETMCDSEIISSTLIALSNLYGIELLRDNVVECRAALEETVLTALGDRATPAVRAAVNRLVCENIVQGNARTLRNDVDQPLLLPTWDLLENGAGIASYFELNALMDKTYSDDSMFDKISHRSALSPVTKKRFEEFDGLIRAFKTAPQSFHGNEPSRGFFFDVVVGNPPYHEPDSGFGPSAAPVYQEFVEQAINLSPKFVLMVVPSRWFVGGKGLNQFRLRMIRDHRIRDLVDFPESNLVFRGTQIKSGVCYFLWDRTFDGPCTIKSRLVLEESAESIRYLRETGSDIFIRFELGLQILKKVVAVENPKGSADGRLELQLGYRFSEIVSARKPFGLDTQFRGEPEGGEDYAPVFRNGGVGFIRKVELAKFELLMCSWKVFVPRASSGFDGFPHQVVGQPFVGGPGSACSETYLAIGPFETETEAKKIISYINSRLFRFLCLLNKAGQDTPRAVFRFVPRVAGRVDVSDSELYRRYGFDDEEISFIEKLVTPTPEASISV